jgi:hypothetical protein
VCGALVELLDVWEEEDDAVLLAVEVAGVAAQLLDGGAVVVVVAGAAAAMPVFVWVPMDAGVWAAESVAWAAIAPARPTSVATLAVAATFRARRAGCGRCR